MLEIGTVKKENVSDDFKTVSGVKLLIMSATKNTERIVITPMTQEGFETFYRSMFEIMGKEWINQDYKKFLEYVLDGNCEFITYIQITDLEDIRPATKEDMVEHNGVMKCFIDKHQLEIEND